MRVSPNGYGTSLTPNNNVGSTPTTRTISDFPAYWIWSAITIQLARKPAAICPSKLPLRKDIIMVKIQAGFYARDHGMWGRVS